MTPSNRTVCVLWQWWRNEWSQALENTCVWFIKKQFVPLLQELLQFSKIRNAVMFIVQREKKSLLKLLSSNKKKSRPSPPSSPTLEAEQTAAGEALQGAMGHDAPPSSSSVSCLEPEPAAAAVASASSSSSSSMVPESSHRKSSPLDGCAPIAPPPRQPCSSLLSQQHDARPIICERYADVNVQFHAIVSDGPIVHNRDGDLPAVIVTVCISH